MIKSTDPPRRPLPAFQWFCAENMTQRHEVLFFQARDKKKKKKVSKYSESLRTDFFKGSLF